MSARAMANPAFLVALGVLAGSALAMGWALDAYGYYLRKLPIHPAPDPVTGRAPTLTTVPPETENWERIGVDRTESAETLEVLGTHNYITRRYAEKRPADGQRPRVVEIHAAYYTGMIDTVPHVPERCFVGAGISLVGGPWTVPIPMKSDDWIPDPESDEGNGPTVYTTRLSNEHSSRPGARVRLPRGLSPERPLQLRVSEFMDSHGNRSYAGYLFIANGGWVSMAEEVRLLAFDLTDDYAYYLKVQFNSETARSPEELAAAAGSLLDDLLGELMRCVPDWADVEAGRYPPDNPKARGREG